MALEITKRDLYNFWTRVTIPEDKSRCWIWAGTCPKGGGYLDLECGRRIRAHRFSYAIYHQLISLSRIRISRKCRNQRCVNPTHCEVHDHALVPTGRARVPQRESSKYRSAETSPNARLDWEKVADIRRHGFAGVKQMAEKYGLSEWAINRILKNEKWTDPSLPRAHAEEPILR